ncbi:oxaloacetate decarboxylase alpha subunit [Hydrogenispora ethanolica]|uniref:Oxaloacetate decarboxylase alpha subunit n=1 Tax=Hydrogenispora ethanolica TaxID=1082276 RepID=A0A4R1R9N4_HYDET|nr:pyruvate carboxylase subunit B [Hydrogenispora ethanolica]TCL62433.1 oxaloacetate decarboxylase alpha subunit [Hydrogenispora ethanolica]
MAGPVRITETIFRDAHQSLWATRMKTEEMMAVAEALDEVGYYSLEAWGGATFDSALRFLKEDPWVRLRRLRAVIRKTPLQMLLRGQNILGYRHYPDEVVREFCRRAVDNGIGIIRVFDALNDIRNMETAIRASKEAGAHVQGTVVYTVSPVHAPEIFVKLAEELVALGADSICIKDMAGLLKPFTAAALVSALKAAVPVPVQLHAHYTSGLASMTYLKAIEAGVDGIDTALSALALGTSQPPTETMVAALQDTPYDTGLDLNRIAPINQYFKELRQNYQAIAAPLEVDTAVLSYQIPGGMISNLRNQLAGQNAAHRYEEVLAEVPRVRAELGYPPLVTPTSQMVGTQAVLNVLTGKRYSVVPKEIRDYVKGLYGRPPAPIDPEIRRLIIGEEMAIEHRPADDLPPLLDDARKAILPYYQQEEDVLSYVLFPEVAQEFFKKRAAAQRGD